MAARLFCIFFALVGIPLNLVVLNRLGHLMQRVVHRCAHRLAGTWQVREGLLELGDGSLQGEALGGNQGAWWQELGGEVTGGDVEGLGAAGQHWVFGDRGAGMG